MEAKNDVLTGEVVFGNYCDEKGKFYGRNSEIEYYEDLLNFKLTSVPEYIDEDLDRLIKLVELYKKKYRPDDNTRTHTRTIKPIELTASEKERYDLYMQGLGYQKIANKLGVSKSSIQQSIRAAKKKLSP